MITDELNTVLDWSKLSMRDRAAFIRLAVANGYKDVDSIRNLYKEGGDKNSNLKKLFLTLLDSSLLDYNQYNTPLWRKFFTDLALLESSFKPNALNDIGAKGYFQLMPYNRSASWSSPTLLFHEMYKLVGANEKTLMKKLTDSDVQKAYNMGIDWFGLLAGAHLGGVGNVIKALRGQGNAKDKNNASVLGYMKQFSQGVIPTRNDALYTIKPDATYTAPIYSTIDTTEHTPVNNITIDTNEDKPIENDNSYRGLIENVSPEVHTGFIPIQQEYMSYAAPMLVLPVLQQQPKVQYEPLDNTSLLLKDLEYTILNGLYANDLEKENLKEDLRFLLNISTNGGRLYQKGSWLKNKLYNFLSNTGGTVRINAGKYTGSYRFGEDYSNATDIKYGGERADTTRNPLALYLGVDTIGMNKLRHDKYILDNDTIDADFFEGKILPEKKDGKPYILQSKLKPEFDALIDNNRTFLMNMNEFPFDPNLYNEQTLDNVRNVRVKPIKDDKGNYFLKLTKLWDLTGSLTGGSTTDWLNEKAGGRPPVLEQIVPMKFEDEYTKENYYINRARELAGNPKAYGGFFNKFAPGGEIEDEEYKYATTYLPEVNVTAPRLYIEGYDDNGNPIYTTDPTKSMGYNAPVLQSHKDIQEALKEKPNTGKQWADLATLGIGLALAPIAAAPVVEAGLPIMNTMARPLTTTAKVGSKLFPSWSKALPYTEMADRGIMGYMGARGVYDTGKEWYNGEIPWYQAVPQMGLEGLMMADAAPLVRRASKLTDAATRKNLWDKTNVFFNETVPQTVKREYDNFKRHIINSKEYENRLLNLDERIFNNNQEISYIPTIESGRTVQNPHIQAAANKTKSEIEKLYEIEDAWRKRKQQEPIPLSKIFETTTEFKAPDFSKMSTENVEKWLDKHIVFPSVKEPLMHDWNDVAKRFEHVVKETGFDPNSAVKTGKIQLIDAATGQTKTFNLDRILNKNTAEELEVFPLTKEGDVYRAGIEKSARIEDNVQALFPEAPKEYLEAVGKNIDYITNEAVSGSKVFGSSANVRAGNLYHDAHDIDVIMPYKEAAKHKEFSNWAEIRPGATYTYRHPTAGDIDVNVIMEDDKGNATGKLAHELYAQMYPKQYANMMKKAIAKGVMPSTDLPLDKTADELFKAFDPVQKSIIDAFASSKDKHMKRAYYFLNYGKLKDVRKGFDGYMKYLTGGEWEPTKVTLSEFDNPSVNSKLIDLLGLKGINKEQFINSPERMKLLFDYSIYEDTFVGRGINAWNKNAQDIIKSATVWYPDTYGGTAKGVGLNTVLGGNSGFGDTYLSIIPNRMRKPNSATIEGVLEEVRRNLGSKSLASEDIKNLRNMARNLQIPETIIRDNTTLSEILENTAGKNGQNYKDFINWIAKEYDIPLITNGMYGQSKYASLLEDLPFDNVVQIFPKGVDRPVSLKAREENIIGNRAVESYKMLEDAVNSIPKNTGKYIDNTPLDLFPTLMKSKEKRIESKFFNTVQKALNIGKIQEKRVDDLLREHWRYKKTFNEMLGNITLSAMLGGIASGAHYVIKNVEDVKERREKRREEKKRKLGKLVTVFDKNKLQ